MRVVPMWIQAVARYHAPEAPDGSKDESLIDRLALSMACMAKTRADLLSDLAATDAALFLEAEDRG